MTSFSRRLPAVVRGMRYIWPLGLGAGCLLLLPALLEDTDLAQVPGLLRSLAPGQLGATLLLTALSFLALGQYDTIAHRHLKTGLSQRQASLAGMAAIALSQTLGFGLITGTLARWRLLPDLSPPTAFRVTLFVTLSFMAALLVACVLVVALTAQPPALHRPAVLLALLLPAVPLALMLWPQIAVGRRILRLPTLMAVRDSLGWAFLDIAAAGLALYVLLGPAAPPVAVFLPAFALALAAGLLSGSPAGVGPFELALITLLPDVPVAALVAALIAYRAIYFALPALIAAASLTFPTRTTARTVQSPLPPSVSLAQAPRAEVGVIRQNGGHLWHSNDGALALWPTGQSLCALFDPVCGTITAQLPALQKEAKAQDRIACVYKTSARSAVRLRRAGWSVLHIADEARLSLNTYDAEGPRRRTLRRKLRHAEKAGIRTLSPPHLPVSEMQVLDETWRAARGPARGGSMGRFCPTYLANQRVVLAYLGNRLVGFASFHHAQTEWCLDLMRLSPDAPDGTMHQIVHNAALHARASGARHLSLAATVACPDPGSTLHRWLAFQAVRFAGGSGLRQFKSSFGPDWQPLYFAAPGRLALVLCAADLALHIHRPTPLPAANSKPLHNNVEDYEVVFRKAS